MFEKLYCVKHIFVVTDYKHATWKYNSAIPLRSKSNYTCIFVLNLKIFTFIKIYTYILYICTSIQSCGTWWIYIAFSLMSSEQPSNFVPYPVMWNMVDLYRVFINVFRTAFQFCTNHNIAGEVHALHIWSISYEKGPYLICGYEGPDHAAACLPAYRIDRYCM